MFSIRQTEAGWEVLDANGVVLFTETDHTHALARLSTLALAQLERPTGALAVVAPPNALPERWISGDFGIVLAADTGDGRDFSECQYTWRDPAVSLLPLMLQTTTDFSHYGAVLAGWMDTLANRSDGGVDAGGWFYDSDAGRQFRDMLSASGRFGVSVDPGAVEWEDVCTEMDSDGFYCIDGVTRFLSYEVIGLTGTPFPAFAQAYITLGETASNAPADDAGEPAAVAAAVAAGATGTLVDAGRFTYPEPPDGDARYVDQGDGRIAIPLTITDDGHVYGHAAAWGTCHIGFRDQCVEPPTSPSGYAQFHLGVVETTNGQMATGALVVNCDHAGRNLAAPAARQHYEHVGLAWADVRASDGSHGVWITGQVREEATPELLRVLRASCLSGDWRGFGTELDCVAIQTVNVPGFPIRRQALAAAGSIMIAAATLRSRRNSGGVIVELAGAGIVRPATARLDALTAAGTVDCAPCAARRRPGTTRPGAGNASTMAVPADLAGRLDAMMAQLGTLERRTRHLVDAEREHVAKRLGVTPRA